MLNDRMPKLRRLAVAMAAVTATVALFPAVAAAQRKAKPEPRPPLDASFPPAIARCGAAYGDALAGQVRAQLAAQIVRAAEAVAVPGADWPGRWLHQEPTSKQTKADALAAAEAKTQERICKERQKRAGRVRCVEWEAAAVAAPVAPPAVVDPPVVVVKPAPVPPPVDEEARDLKLLAGFVAAKGQLVEFGRNGRLEGLVKRVQGDLSAYTGQPPHPALCNGVPEMLEFHAERMEPVQTRLTAIAVLAARTRALAEARVAAAISAGPAETRGKPLAILVAALEQLMLPQGAALATAAPQTAPLAQLRRLLAASRIEPWAVQPVDTQVAASLALRALEAGVYAEQQQLRAAAVERAVFGAIRSISDAHRAHCACAG
jgi:hypothetical protein